MKDNCPCPDVCAATEIDPIKPAKPRDQTTYWNVTTLTNQWQEFYFPIEVTVKPTSYGGGSQNSWTGIDVVGGNLPSQTAGVDAPWETIPAGKAFTLPCGHYFMRASFGNPNFVNVRIYPATVTKNKRLSRLFALPPAAYSVTGASSTALAARVGRSYLYLKNTSTNYISIAFGSSAAVLYSGITLGPGEGKDFWGDDCPESAVLAIASVAGSNLAIQEG